MGKERLSFIDFAKGFAILSVVIFHYSQPYALGLWSKAIMVGGTGVHLFFILSGFGLGLSSRILPALAFYKKRFSKILLPYYVIILLIYFINMLVPMYGDTSLYALGGHLFLYKMLDEKIMGSFGYHFWFISTIVQFYIAYPFIIKLKNKTTSSKFLLVSLCISLAYAILITILDVSDLRIYNSFFLKYLWEFNLGLFWAERYLKNGEFFWEKSASTLLFISLVGIGLMAIMALEAGLPGEIFNDIPASIGYLGLASLIYLIITRYSQPILSLFTYIGNISYELYLSHMLVFFLVNELVIKSIFRSSSILTSLFIILPISIGFAALYSSMFRYVYQFIQSTKTVR